MHVVLPESQDQMLALTVLHGRLAKAGDEEGVTREELARRGYPSVNFRPLPPGIPPPRCEKGKVLKTLD